MKYIITAAEFKTSAKVVEAFMKHSGVNSGDLKTVIELIKTEQWDKIPKEDNVELIFTTPTGAFELPKLAEVVITTDAKRNVEFMELFIPWMERLAPVGIAAWGLVRVFKNVADTMRDDMKALMKKWHEEDKAAAKKVADEQSAAEKAANS